MKQNVYVLLFLLTLVSSSCKKEEGEGGKSKIIGRIWVENYNTLNDMSDTYYLKAEYPGEDEDVYIIYGNDIGYGDKIKAGAGGYFEFNYLRPGNYRIYVESKDTTRTSLSKTRTVDVSATIGKKKQTVDVGTLVIHK